MAKNTYTELEEKEVDHLLKRVKEAFQSKDLKRGNKIIDSCFNRIESIMNNSVKREGDY